MTADTKKCHYHLTKEPAPRLCQLKIAFFSLHYKSIDFSLWVKFSSVRFWNWKTCACIRLSFSIIRSRPMGCLKNLGYYSSVSINCNRNATQYFFTNACLLLMNGNILRIHFNFYNSITNLNLEEISSFMIALMKTCNTLYKRFVTSIDALNWTNEFKLNVSRNV